MSYSANDFATKSVLKPLLAGGIAYLGDAYVLKEPEMMKSATFAGIVTASIAAASMLEPTFESVFLGDQGYTPTKPLAGRLFEIGLAAGSVHIVNKYALYNDNFTEPWKRVSLIVASDIMAEYVVDMFTNK